MNVFPPAMVPFWWRRLPVGKTLTILAILFSGWVRADILDPPSLRCASVNLAGDVALTWVVPQDPGNFFQFYIVYGSNNQSGPFLVIDTLLVYGQFNYTHLGAGADSGPRYYYMTTVSVDPEPNTSVTSDTLATLFLTVSQSTPLGSAVLDWNLLHDPPLATTAAVQLIQLEYPQGTWSQVDQAGALIDNYQQVIAICEDSLTYRIAVQDQLGCVSYSSLAGDVFIDVTAPSPPNMVTVSVDTATNQVVLDWDPSPEDDTNGYIIFINGIIIDSVYGLNNTTYTWINSDAGATSESYTLAAFDTCETGNPPAPNTSATKPAHTSIHATTAYNRCDAECVVTWSPYIGWDVVSYELYSTFNGGPPVLLATLPAVAHTYTHEGLVPFSTYCYVVRAVGDSADMRSLSNLVCQFTDYPALPQSNYLRVASVVEENHIVVVDSVDQSASVRRYRLERTNNGEPWEEIATQPGSTSPTVVFDDLDVLTALRSYTYRVIVEDSCGAGTLTSNQGLSILLIAEAGTDGVNRLHWNGYEQWAGMLSGFQVYRSIGDGPFVPIAFTGPTEWETEDNVNALIASNGRFCYYVEAFESGNPSGIDAVSMSNTACAIQQEAVWVPNAFIAGSTILENSHFQPVVAFVDVKGYEFIIFNRWGQQIWTTTDVNEPWKGQVNGIYVPQGVYAYYVAVYNGAGKKFEERGTVTFLCCP